MSRSVKKIALEEHFVRPDLLDYNQRGVGSTPAEFIARVMGDLLDLGEGRLAIMDAARIDVSVLSHFSPGIQMEPDPAAAQRIAREVNDLLATSIAPWPKRFYGFAHLSMHDGKAAAAELDRCVNQLGFKGALINGHTMGVYLDDPGLLPFWERAEALGVPIYLHPAFPMQHIDVLQDYPGLEGATWGWMAETGGHALRLIFSGLFDRFPGLNVVLGHMGEAIPFLIARIDRGYQFHKRKIELQRLPSDYLRDNFFITPTGVLSNAALRCTIDTVGADRVLFSVDAPFEDSLAHSEFIETAPLSHDEREKICFRNAARLLNIEP